MRKMIIIAAILVIGLDSLAQQVATYRQKISNSKVPKIVSLTFQEQYRDVLLIGWYSTHITYWYEDTYPVWYNGWYEQRQVTMYTFEKPSYYEVEFIDEPGEISRAVYNRYGVWFETRAKIDGLPAHIAAALDKSEYADWKRSAHMEKIEAPGTHSMIYRLSVSKKMKNHIIRIDDNGHIIQVKREGR